MHVECQSPTYLLLAQTAQETLPVSNRPGNDNSHLKDNSNSEKLQSSLFYAVILLNIANVPLEVSQPS